MKCEECKGQRARGPRPTGPDNATSGGSCHCGLCFFLSLHMQYMHSTIDFWKKPQQKQSDTNNYCCTADTYSDWKKKKKKKKKKSTECEEESTLVSPMGRKKKSWIIGRG